MIAMRENTEGNDNNTLSGCSSPRIYCRRADESAKAPPISRVSRCKNTEDLFLARAFRAPDSYFVRGTGLPSVRSAAPINRRRTRFAPRSPLRRDLLKDTCRADVSICNRKYLHPLCNSGAKRRVAATGTALIIPRLRVRSIPSVRPAPRGSFTIPCVRLPPARLYRAPLVYINFAASSDASRPMLRGVLEKALRTRSHRTRSPFSLS